MYWIITTSAHHKVDPVQLSHSMFIEKMKQIYFNISVDSSIKENFKGIGKCKKRQFFWA